MKLGELAQSVGEPVPQRRRRRGGRDVEHVVDRGELVARTVVDGAAGHFGGIDGTPAIGVNDGRLTRTDEFIQGRRICRPVHATRRR